RASIETFRAAYPKIRLDLSGLTPSEYEPKIAAERKASIYSWDVMVSGMGPSTYNVYIPQKWIVPIRDQIRPDIARDDLWLGGFDAGFLDKEKKFVFAMQGVFSSTNWINRAQIPE